jgi:cytochrome c peroxidase
MKTIFLLFVLTLSLLYSFKKKDCQLFVVPKKWPKPEYRFSGNSLKKEIVALGRALFYDPILSADNSISCASCHSPYNAFTHVDHDLSHGIDDRIGLRNSPALMNLAWKKNFMWDGAIVNLDMQSLAPISHPDEMGNTIDKVVASLNHSPRYRKAFFKAFNDSIVTGEYTLKALSQFMLTLVSANSKYDRVMSKKEHFTTQEKNGYLLFQKNCASCHKEPLFTTNEFVNNGLKVDPTLNDFGRMKITVKSSDSLKFTIPTLRNIEYSYPYMHDGRFKKLSQVIQHYSSGIQSSKTLDNRLKEPIALSSNEKVDLLAFLLTLSDKEFIFNSNFNYPTTFF